MRYTGFVEKLSAARKTSFQTTGEISMYRGVLDDSKELVLLGAIDMVARQEGIPVFRNAC